MEKPARVEGSMARGALTLVALSAFGPYVYGGLRTEQIVTYALCAVLVPLLWTRVNLAGAPGAMLGGWLVLVATGGIVFFGPPLNRTGYPSGSALANLDNFCLPLAAILVVMCLVTDENRESLLRRVASIVMVGACVNALIAFGQTQYRLDPYLSHWWSSGSLSASLRAETLGRYSGILNQPALAGITYGIALMCALYLLHDRPVWLIVVLSLLTLGGLIAVTKAFFVVCLPVAGWHLYKMSGKRHRRLLVAILGGLSVYGASVWGVLPASLGADRVLRLLPSANSSLISFYTGNRYGGNASTSALMHAVLTTQPFSGLGFRGLDTATDSAWVQVVVLGGILGAVAFAVVLLTAFLRYRALGAERKEPERRLFAGLLMILVGGSFAFPVLTGNRLAVLAWILLILLASGSPTAMREGPGRAVPRHDEAPSWPLVGTAPAPARMAAPTPALGTHGAGPIAAVVAQVTRHKRE